MKERCTKLARCFNGMKWELASRWNFLVLQLAFCSEEWMSKTTYSNMRSRMCNLRPTGWIPPAKHSNLACDSIFSSVTNPAHTKSFYLIVLTFIVLAFFPCARGETGWHPGREKWGNTVGRTQEGVWGMEHGRKVCLESTAWKLHCHGQPPEGSSLGERGIRGIDRQIVLLLGSVHFSFSLNLKCFVYNDNCLWIHKIRGYFTLAHD